MKPETRGNLLRLIGVVRSECLRIDMVCGERPRFGDEGYSFDASDAWWKQRNQEVGISKHQLAQLGARFTHRAPDGHAIQLAGIRSSSTSGFIGAFQNWIRAAEKRLEKEAGR